MTYIQMFDLFCKFDQFVDLALELHFIYMSRLRITISCFNCSCWALILLTIDAQFCDLILCMF